MSIKLYTSLNNQHIILDNQDVTLRTQQENGHIICIIDFQGIEVRYDSSSINDESLYSEAVRHIRWLMAKLHRFDF